MKALARFLSSKPDFIRLINSVFTVLVVFDVVNVTVDQFGVVVLAVEALFQFVSKIAFARDLEDLYQTEMERFNL